MPAASRVVCVVLVLAMAACHRSGSDPAAGAVPPLPKHELIFAHHSDNARSDYDLWRICGDGSQLASLVSLPGRQIQLSVAPDGNALVYTSPVDGQREVFLLDFSGSEPVNLTANAADDTQPAWSPGGDRIAFFSTRDHAQPELYVMNRDGGAVQRITHNSWYESAAAWTMDEQHIVFSRYFPPAGEAEQSGQAHDGRGELFMVNLADGSERQLTQLGGYNGDASFSPNDQHIAWHRVADGGSEIWVMNADGSEAHAITATFIDEYTPQWSPDGQWLAITAGVGNDSLGTFDLWLLRPDGSHRQLLSAAANTQAWQRWRPGEHYCR